MHKHALVERSILRYRLLTGPLRLLAITHRTQSQPVIHLPANLDDEYQEAEREADTLNPFIPNMGM